MELYTKCTVHDGKGGRCGKRDLCTLVRTLDLDRATKKLKLQHEHRVCLECRARMKLPDYDVAITPYGEYPIIGGLVPGLAVAELAAKRKPKADTT